MEAFLTVAFRSAAQNTLSGSLHHDKIREIFGSSSSARNGGGPLVLRIRKAEGRAKFHFLSVTPSQSAAASPTGVSAGTGGNKRALELDPAAAAAMGLRDGEAVYAIDASRCRVGSSSTNSDSAASSSASPSGGGGAAIATASRVFVEPTTINDSEIAEENASFLEMAMLRLVNVVYVGQRIPAPLPDGTKVELAVTMITVPSSSSGGGGGEDEKFAEDGSACALLVDGCEMCIATKTRRAVAAPGTAPSSAPALPPRSAVLRLLDADEREQCSDEVPPTMSLVVSRQTAERLRWPAASLNDASPSRRFVVGFLDLAIWADALLAKTASGGNAVAASPTSATAPAASSSLQHSESDITTNPSLLRKSASIPVHVVESSDGGGNAPALFCAVVRGGNSALRRRLLTASRLIKRQGATCIFCWPHAGAANSPLRSIEDLLHSDANAAAASSSPDASALSVPVTIPLGAPPSLRSLLAVHEPTPAAKPDADPLAANSLRRIAAILRGPHPQSDGADALAPHSLLLLRRSPKILLTGNRGCGRSTAALRCAIDSGRHVVLIDCGNLKRSGGGNGGGGGPAADFVKQLAAAMLECMLCGPSVLVLEDLECVAARERDLAGGPAAASAPQASLDVLHALECTLRQSSELTATWFTENFCSGGAGGGGGVDPVVAAAALAAQNDIAIIATAQDAEMLHPRVMRHSSTPFGFSIQHRIALPNLDARKELLSQMVVRGGGNASASAQLAIEKLATETEHFSPSDLRVLLRMAARELPEEPDEGGDDHRALTLLQHAHRLASNRLVVPFALANVSFLNNNKKGKGNDGGGSAASLSWAHVGGLAAAKAVLNECIVLPCRYPAIFDRLPLKARSGVLLYGPMGCGKSHIVACLAAAENLNCIVVNGPEILDKYIGASEAKIRDVFERAQSAAPCVLFLDEFESIAPQRGNDNTGVTDRVVNQLLCYLDGVEARGKVFVVAASGRPDLIDAALLRPGRLDRHVLCGFPTQEERREILRAHIAQGLPDGAACLGGGSDDDSCREGKQRVDVDAIADRCENWTSADLAALVTSASVAFAKRQERALKDFEERRRQKQGNGAGAASSSSSATATRVLGDGRQVVVAASAALLGQKDAAKAAALAKRFQALVSVSSDSNAAGAAATASSSASAAVAATADTAPVCVIGQEDFDEAIKSTRPSCSEREVRRLRKLFEDFANRGKRGGGGQPQPGSKLTMA